MDVADSVERLDGVVVNLTTGQAIDIILDRQGYTGPRPDSPTVEGEVMTDYDAFITLVQRLRDADEQAFMGGNPNAIEGEIVGMERNGPTDLTVYHR